jgi:hypothetical protein
MGHCYFALIDTLLPHTMVCCARKAEPLASLWDAERFRPEKPVVSSLRSSTFG